MFRQTSPFLLFIAIIFMIFPVAAISPPDIIWEKSFDILGSSVLYDICPTQDGGFAAVGTVTTSHTEYVTDTSEILIVRTDTDGNELWHRNYRGPGFSQGSGIAPTADGGFIVVGNGMHLQSENPALLLLKIDQNGEVEWTQSFGRNGTYVGTSVAQTRDGGYIACGWMTSGLGFDPDLYLLRTSSSGEMIWETRAGGEKMDEGNAVIELSDSSGFVAAGWTDSRGAGSGDLYLVGTDNDGKVLWEQTYGDTGYDVGEDVKEIPGEGFVIAGEISLPIDRVHPEMSLHKESMYIVRTDTAGNQVWAQQLGSTRENCIAHSVALAPDGGFILAGQIDRGENGWDNYMVRADDNGLPVWERTWGGSGFDVAYATVTTADRGYITSGVRGEGSGTNVTLDADITRFAPDQGSPGSPLTGTAVVTPTLTPAPTPLISPPSIIWESTYSVGLQSQALDVIQTRDGGYAIAGITLVSNVNISPSNPLGQDSDAFLIRTDIEGNELWARTYGNNSNDGAYAVKETLDRGFILAGYTSGPEHYDADKYLVRTDSAGIVVWEKHYDTNPGFDALHALCTLSDGNFIGVGETDQGQNYGARAGYLAEIAPNGEILWEKLYPGTYSEGYPGGIRSLDCAGDTGYLLGIYGAPALVRTDSRGNAIWSVYNYTVLADARLSRDGGAIFTGVVPSPATGHPLLLLQKTDSSGRTEWTTAAPYDWSWGRAVEVTSDGGFLAVGTTAVLNGATPEITYNTTYNLAIQLLKTDSQGTILWTTTLSPARFNEGIKARETSDGGYAVLGTVADEAGLEYLLSMGNIPGKIYLAKLAGESGITEGVMEPAGAVTQVITGTPVILETGVEPDVTTANPEIPLVYAPLLAILVSLVLVGWRKL
jgi:hypothetical protein